MADTTGTGAQFQQPEGKPIMSHYVFEEGVSGVVILHEDGTHGAFIPDGESGAIPVEWVRGDGPDRLATPTDWEQSYMPVQYALAASTDPDWWVENRTLVNDLRPVQEKGPWSA